MWGLGFDAKWVAMCCTSPCTRLQSSTICVASTAFTDPRSSKFSSCAILSSVTASTRAKDWEAWCSAYSPMSRGASSSKSLSPFACFQAPASCTSFWDLLPQTCMLAKKMFISRSGPSGPRTIDCSVVPAAFNRPTQPKISSISRETEGGAMSFVAPMDSGLAPSKGGGDSPPALNPVTSGRESPSRGDRATASAALVSSSSRWRCTASTSRSQAFRNSTQSVPGRTKNRSGPRRTALVARVVRRAIGSRIVVSRGSQMRTFGHRAFSNRGVLLAVASTQDSAHPAQDPYIADAVSCKDENVRSAINSFTLSGCRWATLQATKPPMLRPCRAKDLTLNRLATYSMQASPSRATLEVVAQPVLRPNPR
mmetsp:Transcript_86413/g.231458  ORF Transcript_86413/g.231458 Transcript_86413/m.231458 type:complete len:367 (+) Transcript_86413:512-1612(+)